MTSLDGALVLAARGFHVFPVDHPAVLECAGLHGPSSPCDGKRGKHPAARFYEAATTDQDEILDMFGGLSRNIGIACKPSRLVVLDEDAPYELARWCRDHGVTLPHTYTVATHRGKHYYFIGPPDAEIGNGEKPFKGYSINVRGYAGRSGGYVVGPGSVHASGFVYTAEDPDAKARLPAARSR